MMAALYIVALALMVMAAIVFLAVGTVRTVDLDHTGVPFVSRLPAVIGGILLLTAQAALWVAVGLKYGGAW